MGVRIYLTASKPSKGTIHLPLIKTKPIKRKLKLNNIDALIFTSKYSITYSLKMNKKLKKLPAIAVGLKTAKELRKNKIKVLDIAKENNVKSLIKLIKEKYQNHKFLYLRAKKIAFDIKKELSIKEKIIYKTKYIKYDKNKKPKKNSIIIFSSPSTIKAFLKNFSWEETYKAVAIGSTTLKELSFAKNKFIAKKRTIKSCVKTAKALK